MAAGQGFKTFATGDVLSASDVNGYLMQGVLVFASSTARDAAITSPQEGQFAYLKDTNVTTYYTGSAWANLDTTGMTNPMTTTGDTIYSSSGSTPARLGIGTAGQFLAVNSGATAPEWVAAPSGGANYTLLNAGGTALTGATVVTVSGISAKDKIFIAVQGASAANASSQIGIRLNTATTNYNCNLIDMEWTTTYSNANYNADFTTPTSMPFAITNITAAGTATGSVLVTGANSSGVKVCQIIGSGAAMGAQGGHRTRLGQHLYTDSATISSISVVSSSGNLDAGTVYVYTSA